MRTAIRGDAPLAAVCAIALAGCGGGSGDESAQQAAQSYVDAHNSRDFDQLCDLLSDQFRRRLGGGSCPSLIAERTSGDAMRPLKLVSVRDHGGGATAMIQTTSASGAPVRLTLVFGQQGGSWRVTGF